MSRYRSADRRQHVKELYRIRCDERKRNHLVSRLHYGRPKQISVNKKEESVACRMKEKNRTQSECGTLALNEEFLFFLISTFFVRDHLH
ncbi:hypothetical protein CDAR_446151 [Caerostris darwini]|uniref:Uncharacterized protein n=1 Tax=Caerostris darwini TaxID=1538125 RepID=A0AAV4SLW3_9ARAC|nr:hypothetical protein CDAR_446151 [Caerostris darwini]